MVSIKIKHKNNYGNDLMYVCDPEHARIITQLTSKRTVDQMDIYCLRQLGLEVIDLDEKLREMLK